MVLEVNLTYCGFQIPVNLAAQHKDLPFPLTSVSDTSPCSPTTEKENYSQFLPFPGSPFTGSRRLQAFSALVQADFGSTLSLVRGVCSWSLRGTPASSVTPLLFSLALDLFPKNQIT